MAPRLAEYADPALKARIVAGSVLGCIALADVLLGGWFFAVLTAIAALLAAHEWANLTVPRRRRLHLLAFALTAAFPVIAILLEMLGEVSIALPVLLLGSLCALCVATLVPGMPVFRAGFGPLYIGLPCLALVWLRNDNHGGLESVVWLLMVVWTSDVFAYFVGRRIGGPRLAPMISPGKTWAGLIGGTAFAAAMGGLLVLWLHGDVFPSALLAAVIAICAHAGDLFESYVKRVAGVKDSGTLIPGHGGILDRVDGLMFAAPVYAGISYLLPPGALP